MTTPAGWYQDPGQPGGQRYWDGSQWTEDRVDYAAQPAPQVPPMKPRRTGLILAGVIGGILLLLIGIGLLLPEGTTEQASPPTEPPTQVTEEAAPPPPVKEAKFKGRVGVVNVVNPATVRVFVSVENTGNAPGYARCTIRVQDESGTYKGFDFFDLPDEIKPGKFDGFNGLITVTNEGALFVTQKSADCEPYTP